MYMYTVKRHFFMCDFRLCESSCGHGNICIIVPTLQCMKYINFLRGPFHQFEFSKTSVLTNLHNFVHVYKKMLLCGMKISKFVTVSWYVFLCDI